MAEVIDMHRVGGTTAEGAPPATEISWYVKDGKPYVRLAIADAICGEQLEIDIDLSAQRALELHQHLMSAAMLALVNANRAA